jgi:hypothetical protein
MIYGRIFKAADPQRVGLRRRAFAVLHRTLAGSYFVAGRYRQFVRHALTSLMLDPREAAYFAAAALRQVGRRASV